MDYRDKVFLSVAENLSFSKAAKDLFISQPAVTRHIKELEQSLKTALFERKGNKIYLTQSGKLTYRYFKIISDHYQDFEFELGRLNNTFKGSLKVGASSTISQYLIPSVMAEFHQRYPDIKLQLFNGNSFEMEQKLIQNKIDLALVENQSSLAHIKYKDFMDDELVLVTGSQSVYAKKGLITALEFANIPIVLREKGSGTLQVIRSIMEKHQIALDELNILMHLGSTEAIKNFLCRFDGVALVSEQSIDKELRLNEITKINIKGLAFNRKFRMAIKPGHEVFSAKLFMEFLSNYNF